MPKVYVVSEGDYKGIIIRHICATRELAEAYVATCDIPGIIDVDEWELDGAFAIRLK